ncbi:TPA: hypothetical protein ACGJ62_006355, partial [Pseudomonas aeruginosa]
RPPTKTHRINSHDNYPDAAGRKSGKLPVTVGDSLPSLVATQTIEDRYYSRPVRFGGAS